MNARSRYDRLTTYRQQFLDEAVECARLTLPHLITSDLTRVNHRDIRTPWQSVGHVVFHREPRDQGTQL